MARWPEQLQEYAFEIVRRPGRRHSNADAPSRRPCDQCGRPTLTEVQQGDPLEAPKIIVSAKLVANTADMAENELLERPPTEDQVMVITVRQPLGAVSHKELRQLQMDDPGLGPIMIAKEKDQALLPEHLKGCSREVQQLAQQWGQLSVEGWRPLSPL